MGSEADFDEVEGVARLPMVGPEADVGKVEGRARLR